MRIFQTSQPHIYASGDITNSLKFTHTADFTARIVVRNILMPFQFLPAKSGLVSACRGAHIPIRRSLTLAWVRKKQDEKTSDTICFGIAGRYRSRRSRESISGFCENSRCQKFGQNSRRDHRRPTRGRSAARIRARDEGNEIGLGTIASTIHAYPTFAELARKAGNKFNKTRLTPRAKKIFTWLYRPRAQIGKQRAQLVGSQSLS